MEKARHISFVWMTLASAASWAEVPPPSSSRTSSPVWIIDEFVSDEGKARYEGSISFTNNTSTSTKGSGSGFLRLSPTHIVPIVSSIDTVSQQTNQITGMLGVRYGVTSTADVGLRATGSWSQTRQYENSAGESKSSQSFALNSLSWNGTTRLFQGGDSSMFAFSSIGLHDKVHLKPFKSRNVSFRSATLGLGGYVVDDPVVFSLTTSATISRTINFGGNTYKQGTLFSLSPGVSFLANDRVTLSSGIELSYQTADRYSNQKLDHNRSRTHLLLGAGYAANERVSLYINYISDMTSGPRENTAQLSFMYKN